MSQPSPSHEDHARATEDSPRGDPWHAFGYLVSGVALYGFLGWLADQWLGTSYLVALGIIVGASLGLYLTYSRFNAIRPASPVPPQEDHPDPGPRPDTDTDTEKD